MTYPHKTYLLDDGRRENIKELALSLGVNYITRSDNEHAKAGNINNALKQTDGDFVAILDADHVPLPDFLERLLGQFEDPKMAFVQSPQTFYNLDALEKDVDFQNGKQSEQAEIFFHLIMPGKNRWNSAYFCGTGGIFRREALDQIGGFATETITEDIHTAIKIHGLGWKSVYVAEHLVSGLAPSDMGTYHTQRTRWATGNLSVMFRNNPITCPGLTLAQRLSYLSSMFYWTNGLRKIVFYLSPIIVLLFGIYPAENFTPTLIFFFSLNIFFQTFAFKIVTYCRGRISDDELYDMMNFWAFTSSFFRSCFNFKNQKFETTNKSGGNSFSITSIKPHIIFVIFSIAALVAGMTKLRYNINVNAIGICLSCFWCLWHMYLALMVMQFSAEPASPESRIRFFDYIPVLYKSVSSENEKVALTKEYDSDSLEIFFPEEMEIGSELDVTLILKSFRLPVKIKIANKVEISGSRVMRCYKVQLTEIDRNYTDMLNAHTMLYTVPSFLDYLSEKGKNMLRGSLFKSLWSAIGKNTRVDFPVNINSPHNNWEHCRTKKISMQDAAVTVDHPLESGSSLGFMIATPSGEINGKAKVLSSELVKSHGADTWQADIEFESLDDKSKDTIKDIINA